MELSNYSKINQTFNKTDEIISDGNQHVSLPLPIFILIPVLLLLQFIYRTHFTRVAKLLNKFPGAPIIPFLGNVGIFIGKPQQAQKGLTAYVKKYGKVSRFWMQSGPRVLIADAAACEKILSSSKQIEKGDDYKNLLSILGNGLITSGGHRWRKDRKMLNPSFNRQLFEGFFKIFNKESKKLVEILDKKFENNSDFSSLQFIISNATLGIGFESALGMEMNIQEEGENGPYVIATKKIVESIHVRIFKPWIYNRFVYRFTKPYRIEREALAQFEKGVRMALEKRKERLLSNNNSEKTRSFIDIVLMDEEMSERDVIDHLITIVTAGSDSTALSVLNTLFYLALYPEHQKTVHEELDAIFQGSERDVTLEDLSKTKFLDMCWKETLRMRNSVPVISRKVEEDLEIDGKIIPASTSAILSLHDLHYDPEVFPNPDKYDPYRFTQEEIRKRPNCSYLPFSYGVRGCIGMKYAEMDSKTILINILKKFSVSTNQKEEEIGLIFAIASEPFPEILLRLEKRIN